MNPLSVFPNVLTRLVHARHEPGVDPQALSRIIKTDPALCFMAMRLDRAMNTGSQPEGPVGIEATVSRIGMAGVDAIAVQAQTNQALNTVLHQQAVSLEWLWRHCLTTALLAQGLALEINFRPVEEAYIAGLLHDIGKLVLCARTPETCAPMLADPVQANPLLEAEARVVGSDHGSIGAELIRRHTHTWSAADAARFHTAPLSAVKNALPLVQIVWAANHLAVEPHPSPEACQAVGELLSLDPRDLNQRSRRVAEQVLAVKGDIDPVVAGKGHTIPETAALPLGLEVSTAIILSTVYKELLAATGSSAIIRVLRQSLSVFVGVDALILFAHEPQKDLLIGRFAAGIGFPGTPDRLRIPLTASDSLPAICHRHGEAVDSFSLASRGKLTITDHQLMDCMGKDGLLGLPLATDTRNGGGCLLLGIDESDRPMLREQKNLLRSIAAAVAGALQREHRQQEQINHQTENRHAFNLTRTRKIVHEINNPLSVIKNYLKVLTLQGDEHRSGMDEIRIIRDEIDRVAGLIRSLTSPSVMLSQPIEPVDVNATIADIMRLFRESLPGKKSVRLDQDLDERIPVIDSNRNLLKQALMNLLKNATEAVPDDGTIAVSTRMLPDPRRHTGHGDGMGCIKISICDNGPGIDQKLQAQLFSPYVTSKTGHDGLGLSIAHEAVLHLKGSLICESAPGRGTCFFIKLPVGDHGSANTDALDPAV
ncbi:HDOD domain-containing protein [Desulfosarcina sp.]|uniref:HDOD domain-containing protein n=1 Tax=Desulfosarcina sp. TaxID=2027861 RepID=UPI003970D06A